MHCNRLAPVDFEKHRALTECPGCIYGVANGSLPRPCWPYSSLYEYNDLDKRFDAWKVPALIPLKGIWVGNLSAMPVLTGGTAPTDPKFAQATGYSRCIALFRAAGRSPG